MLEKIGSSSTIVNNMFEKNSHKIESSEHYFEEICLKMFENKID